MAKKPTSPPPAYFLSLSLENVRSFGHKQTISFAQSDGRPAQWTIILGDNGVGKTTVLKALAAMCPVEDPEFKKLSDYNNLVFSVLYVEYWKYNWEPVRNEKSVTNLTSSLGLGVYLSPNSRIHSIPIKVEQNISVNWDDGNPGKQCNVLPYDLSGFYCSGYGAGRTVGNSTIGESPASADTCASLFDDRADLLDPQEWFLNIDYGSKLAGPKNTSLAEARDRVERMLIDVLPGVTKLQIANAGTPQKPQISLQFLLYDTWVKLRDMSLGYQTLVVWLTDLASKLYVRYPESENPLAEPAIVLIDEIDLHLHPRWQRELLASLSKIFPNTQFIATAHSPLVVQAAGDAGANVVLLRREGDQTVVVKDLPDVHRWRLEQILSSELFDDTSPLSPQTDADLTRRNELLLKKRLTAKEKAELERLSADLTTQPVGTTAPERRAEDLLAKLARNMGQADVLK